jgi:DNA ligase-1
MQEFPAHIRAYDLLVDETEDLRDTPFAERREKLVSFVKRLNDPRIDISPLVPFDSWEALTAARADPGDARRPQTGRRGEQVDGDSDVSHLAR